MEIAKNTMMVLDEYIEDNLKQFVQESEKTKLNFKNTVYTVVEEQMGSGKSLNQVLSSIDVIEIKKKLVQESKKGVQEKQKKKVFNPFRFVGASLFSVLWWIPGLIIGFAALIVILVGLAAFFLPVYGGFAFGIYDLGPAFGIFFLTLGATPIIMFIAYWIFAILWEVVRFWINVDAKAFNSDTTIPETLSKINFIQAGKHQSWKAFFTIGAIFTLMFLGSAAGTLAPKDGVLGAVVRDRYVYEQKIQFDVLEEANKASNIKNTKIENINTITFWNIWSHKNLDGNKLFKEAKPNELAANTIQIIFKYNTKQKDEKISYTSSFEKNNKKDENPGNLVINFKYPAIESMMNVKGYGYEIKYSPDLESVLLQAIIINR